PHDDDQPDRHIADDLSKIAAPTGKYADGQKPRYRHQEDDLSEILIGDPEGLAAVVVDNEEHEACTQYKKDEGQSVHDDVRSRAMRRRFVSRLGLRSTVARRSGRTVINCARSLSE